MLSSVVNYSERAGDLLFVAGGEVKRSLRATSDAKDEV